MLTVSLSTTSDLDAIGQRWRAFEAVAAPSFFQSWTWVGCLAAERFDAPMLLEASLGGQAVAMALFNRRRRLWLGESGVPALDAVFVEHNGFLLAQHAASGETLQACLHAVLATRRPLTMNGVDAAHSEAARAAGAVFSSRRSRLTPYVDLAGLRRDGRSYLPSLSANTRYQLRRSLRGYAARGPVQVSRAETAAEAHAALDALGVLHQATWTRRGHDGAFANPDFVRFHHTLIDRAFAIGGIDLLCITAGDEVLGYLYNLRHGGRVCAYQSGFRYEPASGQARDAAGSHLKPGLTCHHLAIERYLAEGANTYDFLAGGDRYKTSLSSAAEPLYWLDLVHRHTVRGLFGRVKSRLKPAYDHAAA